MSNSPMLYPHPRPQYTANLFWISKQTLSVHSFPSLTIEPEFFTNCPRQNSKLQNIIEFEMEPTDFIIALAIKSAEL